MALDSAKASQGVFGHWPNVEQQDALLIGAVGEYLIARPHSPDRRAEGGRLPRFAGGISLSASLFSRFIRHLAGI
jgi:hypothetical protein